MLNYRRIFSDEVSFSIQSIDDNELLQPDEIV